MRKLVLFAVVLPFMLAPGCPVRQFKVEMKRTADGQVLRELTIWTSEDSNISEPAADVLETARLAYGAVGDEVGKKRSFADTFGETLPADLVHEGLNNHGFVGATSCPMGRVVTYVERMPGRNDLFALVAGAEELADIVTKVWVAWVRQERSLQREPEKLERLVMFLENELRDDMLNIMLMAWRAVTRVSTLEDADSDENEAQADLWQVDYLGGVSYLVERGYFRPGEVALLREDGGRVALRAVLRKAAAAMGCDDDEPWPPALERLRDPDAAEAAFEQGLTLIGLTFEELEQRYAPLLPEIFGTGTRGRVLWHCPTPPLETSGAWDEEKRELAWEAEGRQGCETPQLLFAIWAEPDGIFQNEHLGRVMLAGERLTTYVTWLAGLSAAELRKWDAFIASLRPEQDVVQRLSEFRFTPPTTMPSTQPADQVDEGLTRGAKLILGR